MNRFDKIQAIKEGTQSFVNKHWSRKFPDVELASKRVVLCDGNPYADIFAIFRDLGKTEAEIGKPVVGRAGGVFRRWAKMIGLDDSKDFFITNTVPLWPYGNRAFPREVRNFFEKPVVRELIEIVQPAIIMPFGNEAFETIMGYPAPITKMAGKKLKDKDGRIVIPAAHPSYILRGASTEEEKCVFVKPLRKAKKIYLSLNTS